jgi:hypothetical protein
VPRGVLRVLRALRAVSHHGYTDRTIRKVLDGEGTNYQTIVDICGALGIDVESGTSESNEVAPEEYGAYAKTNFGEYAGNYFGYRRTFAKSRKILRSCFSIVWSNGRLVFSERQSFALNAKSDPTPNHNGNIYISAHTGLLHLMATFQGAVRLITLTKLQNRTMQGVVLMQSERKLFYQPSVSALLLEKIDCPSDESFTSKAVHSQMTLSMSASMLPSKRLKRT